MKDQILRFPKQLSKGVEVAKNITIDKTHEKVIICGMGGSIIPAEMFLLSRTQKESEKYFINRDYGLPDWADKNDLVICISWSGNTEETISSYKEAGKRNMETVVLTGGGQLKVLAWTDNSKLIILPDDKIPPRFGVGYMIGALSVLLGAGEDFDFDLKAENMENEGKKLAEEIGNKIPIIYASFRWRKLANFWKILFNENAKIPAFWNYFPSLAHNEIAGFSELFRNAFHPILIKDANDNERQIRNFDAAIAIFQRLGYDYSIVNLSTDDKTPEKIIKNYILGLWASCFVAENLGIKPEDVAIIEDFKRLKITTPHIKLAK